MEIIRAILTQPADAKSPAQLAVSVNLPPDAGEDIDNVHIRVEIDGGDYPWAKYGGPARRPVCVSLWAPTDGSAKRSIRAVAYARDGGNIYARGQNDLRVLAASDWETISWPAPHPQEV